MLLVSEEMVVFMSGQETEQTEGHMENAKGEVRTICFGSIKHSLPLAWKMLLKSLKLARSIL